MSSPHPTPGPSARTTLLRALLALASLSAVGTLHAELIAYESFNSYATGALNGKTGGSGWVTEWTAVANIAVSDTAISYASSGVTLGGGKSLKLGATNNAALKRHIPHTLQGENFYVSFVFQIRDGSNTPPNTTKVPGDLNVFAGWQALDDDPKHEHDTIGYTGQGGKVGARIRNSVPLATELYYNTSYFFVIKYTDWGNSSYRRVRVWLNPALNQTSEPGGSVFQNATQTGDGSEHFLGLQVRTVLGNGSVFQLVDDIRVGTTWRKVADATPAAETRQPHLWPFSTGSLWNTPIGRGVEHGLLSEHDGSGTADNPLSVDLNTEKGQLNYTTFSTPVNIGVAGDSPVTIRQVAAGKWSPAITTTTVQRAPATIRLAGDMLSPTVINYDQSSTKAIGFTNVPFEPDGFMALIDTVSMTATEAYKTCWTYGGNTTSNRVLIARTGSVNTFDLYGDGWTQQGARASKLSFLGGLVRKEELTKAATDPRNAIRHALAMAIPNKQLLNPNDDAGHTPAGRQWPARGIDTDGPTNYNGIIRMGTQFMLHPKFNIENSGLSPEGKALAYALRDYGAYVTDRSGYVSLYAEVGGNSTAAESLKAAWKDVLIQHLVPVLNNSQTNIGGPGTRSRPPAVPFAN